MTNPLKLPFDVTPDASDGVLMSIGGAVVVIGRTAFNANFMGGLIGVRPDKNDRVLMSIGGRQRAVDLTNFSTNFVGGLSKTYPDKNDYVLMSIGGSVVPVSQSDFIAGGWGINPPTFLPTVSSAPAGAWSLTKLVSVYSGPVAAACAIGAPDGTPGTSVDISSNSDGTPDFSAAVTAFGNAFCIWKNYDQTGNGNHAVQSASAYRPIIDVRYVLGKAAWMADATNYGFLDIPTSLSLSRQSLSHFAVIGNANGGSSTSTSWVAALGQTDIDDAAQFSTVAYGPYGGLSARITVIPSSALMIDTRATVAAWRLSASALKISREADTASFAAPATGSPTGGRLGGAVIDAADFGHRHYAHVVYPTALSDTDYGTVRTALDTIFGIQSYAKQVIADGDSIQLGFGSDYRRNKWYYVNAAGVLASSYAYNVACGGITQQYIVANRDSTWFDARFQSGFSRNVYEINAGINDINGGLVDTDINADTATLIARAKTAGFAVVVETLLPFGLSGTKETYRLSVNAWRRANAATLGYTLVDYGDAGTGIELDGTNHPTSAGYQAMSVIAGPVIAAALA